MAKQQYIENRHKSKTAKLDIKRGDKFSRLTIMEEIAPYIPKPGKQKQRKFRCLCSCGNKTEVVLRDLRSGNTKSCGCLNYESWNKYRPKKFGGVTITEHPIYNVWHGMRARCNDPNNSKYKFYGEKGISTCDEWMNNPKAFIGWALDAGWEKGLYIDRIDVDGDYTPGNCRFVDAGLNARNSHLLSSRNRSGYRGVSFCGRDKNWRANITCDGDRHFLGSFVTREYAASAYDRKARELNMGHPLNFLHEEVLL